MIKILKGKVYQLEKQERKYLLNLKEWMDDSSSPAHYQHLVQRINAATVFIVQGLHFLSVNKKCKKKPTLILMCRFHV